MPLSLQRKESGRYYEIPPYLSSPIPHCFRHCRNRVIESQQPFGTVRAQDPGLFDKSSLRVIPAAVVSPTLLTHNIASYELSCKSILVLVALTAQLPTWDGKTKRVFRDGTITLYERLSFEIAQCHGKLLGEYSYARQALARPGSHCHSPNFSRTSLFY
ncbi:hypothetical protein FRC03_003476 [Tulasnella sp. 419]|nr:hypothetical protein FRC03_003476 [Tulasnella sp. 419]